MFTAPRVTIGIPTYNRPALLPKAIASALGQSRPTRVLVADQTGEAEEAVRPFLGNPLVRYLKTDAACLWENWTAAAAACDTEFFAWLQDDDLLAPHFAQRVAMWFDAFQDARLYVACLGISNIDGLANWWEGTGPMVPMDLLHGFATVVDGRLMEAGGYFTSFALSPGVAFRCDPAAIEAVRRCPKDCDLYVERIILAELARNTRVICDPAKVGYWVHHGANESARQNRAGGGVSQYPALVAHLDGLLGGREDWIEPLAWWATIAGANCVRHWLMETKDHAGNSETFRRARRAIADAVGVEDPADGRFQDERAAVRQEPTRDATDKRRKAAHKAVTR